MKKEQELTLERFSMFRCLSKPAIPLLLATLMAAAGGMPVQRSACGLRQSAPMSKECKQACCAKAATTAASCCSKPIRVAQPCHCSVQNERPVTPPTSRRTSELQTVRLAEYVAAEIVVRVADRAPRTGTETLSLCSPSLRQQAVLCRWLI
jgi:hypothetical protein